MALKIRLRQQGKKNRHVFRLVLTDSRSPRDGKYKETLGWYNPYEAEDEKNHCIRADRVEHWLNQGAELSERAEKLVKRSAPEVIQNLKKKTVEARAKACQKKRATRKKATAAA